MSVVIQEFTDRDNEQPSIENQQFLLPCPP
jgi:hypothetical protein